MSGTIVHVEMKELDAGAGRVIRCAKWTSEDGAPVCSPSRKDTWPNWRCMMEAKALRKLAARLARESARDAGTKGRGLARAWP